MAQVSRIDTNLHKGKKQNTEDRIQDSEGNFFSHGSLYKTSWYFGVKIRKLKKILFLPAKRLTAISEHTISQVFGQIAHVGPIRGGFLVLRAP